MKSRKPKPERWYKTPPEESAESADNPTNKLSAYLYDSATIGLGGNSIEERLGNIQVLLKKISRDLSFIALVIFVSLVLGLIGILANA